MTVWGLASSQGVIFAGSTTETKVLIFPLDRQEQLEWPVSSVPGRLFAGELLVSRQPVLLSPGKSSFNWTLINPKDPVKFSQSGYTGFGSGLGYAFAQGVAGSLKGVDVFFLVGRDGIRLDEVSGVVIDLPDLFRNETVFHAIAFLPEWQTVFALTEGKVVRWNLNNDFVDEMPVCSYLLNLGVTLLLDPRSTHRGSFWLSCPPEDRVVYYDHYGEVKWQVEGKKPMGLVFDPETSKLFVSLEDGLGVFDVSH